MCGLHRIRYRWEDNIKIDFRYYGVVWTELIWFRKGTSGGFL
jgi:hypothetical protein